MIVMRFLLALTVFRRGRAPSAAAWALIGIVFIHAGPTY
jgi:hypothetical protein